MRRITGAGTIAALLLALAAPASATELDQRIEEGQQVATDRAELGTGHVDLGPRYDEDGAWSLMVHDDTATAGSVWRDLDRTVLRVHDAAVQQVPDDPAYSFLGAAPGQEVYVVPQTQDPEVVWIGWNTQDPQVMETVDRGVTLSLVGAEGPGELVVYLQDGGFGEPGRALGLDRRRGAAAVGRRQHPHPRQLGLHPPRRPPRDGGGPRGPGRRHDGVRHRHDPAGGRRRRPGRPARTTPSRRRPPRPRRPPPSTSTGGGAASDDDGLGDAGRAGRTRRRAGPRRRAGRGPWPLGHGGGPWPSRGSGERPPGRARDP